MGCAVFVLWEVYDQVEQPLVPWASFLAVTNSDVTFSRMRLFLDGRWTAAVIVLGRGDGVYYD
jgi:hypothetical protein